MNEHAVVIVGGGPTGMMLGAELRLCGVDVLIVERRTSPELVGSRAGGLHARTIEVLDQRGVAQRFLEAGQKAQVAGFGWIRLDISDLPTRHPYGLALFQNHIERILAGWIEELAVPMLRGREVEGLAQDAEGVSVSLAGGEVLRARWLVGCDGGRSLVRKAAGIDFPGWEASTSQLIAEVELAEEPEWGLRRDALGIRAFSKGENGRVRLLVTEQGEPRSGEPTEDELREALVAAWGKDFGVHGVTWLSRFGDAARQAASYRRGRVLLAGDAAHVHFPAGGQGLNVGVQDAVNLGWKLAQVVKGTSPESLLDTYHAERHPVAARVLQNTLAQVALLRPDDRSIALHGFVAELLAMDEPRRRFGAMMSGLDVRYDLGEGHPLLGRRMPDLDLATAGGAVRVYSLLHQVRPVLIELGEERFDASPWGDRVQRIAARTDGPWELPAIGAVPAPSAVLVRPDGHVAWVGQGSHEGLPEAITRWFGAAAA